MNVAVLGATGRTGRPLVEQLLRRGHSVIVLVRDPARLGPLREKVTVVTGSSTDADALDRVLDGADAVVSALGPAARDSTLQSDTAHALVPAMRRHGVTRFVGVSGTGVDVPGDRKGRRDRAISWVVRRVGGTMATDKAAEHDVFAASSLDWTLVRPPRLLDGPAIGRVVHDARTPGKSSSIRRADLAAFLTDVLDQHLYSRQAPFVSQG